MIKLWRGFHSFELLDLVKGALEKKYLLILVSPTHKDFSFVSLLPNGPIELIGDWAGTKDLQKTIEKEASLLRKNLYPDTPALGVFTSGTSSGYSRLILYTKENLIASLESIRTLFETKRIKKIFCFPQPTHIFGLALGYVQAALYDLELVVGEGKYSRETQRLWFESVDTGTLTLGAPAHFCDLIASISSGIRSADGAPGGKPPPAHLSSAQDRNSPDAVAPVARQVSYASICGGAPVSRELWLQMRDVLKISAPSIGYGASEASPGVTHLAPGVEPMTDGEIGEVLPGVSARIVEGHGFEFAGPNLCLAYVENRKLVFPDKMLLGDWIEDHAVGGLPPGAPSRLVFRGRFSAIINRGGQKYSLERIESFIKLKSSLDCIAVGIPEARLGEELGLLIRGHRGSANGLMAELQNEFGFSTEHVLVNYVSELPLNQNFKPDRHRARILIFKPSLPSPVSEFSRWLPHREDAVWVDSVLEADANSGVCEVTINKQKNYFDQNGLRGSSYIEWMAQSYGYVKAYQELSAAKTTEKPKRVFLVAVKDFELLESSNAGSFRVAVRQTHQLGPMALVAAEVTDSDGKVVAKGELKLFAELS